MTREEKHQINKVYEIWNTTNEKGKRITSNIQLAKKLAFSCGKKVFTEVDNEIEGTYQNFAYKLQSYIHSKSRLPYVYEFIPTIELIDKEIANLEDLIKPFKIWHDEKIEQSQSDSVNK